MCKMSYCCLTKLLVLLLMNLLVKWQVYKNLISLLYMHDRSIPFAACSPVAAEIPHVLVSNVLTQHDALATSHITYHLFI